MAIVMVNIALTVETFQNLEPAQVLMTHGVNLRQVFQVQDRTFKRLGLWREVQLETSRCR